MFKVDDIVINKKQSRDNVIPYLILDIKDNQAKCKNILDLYTYIIPLDDLKIWIRHKDKCKCKKNNFIRIKEENDFKPYKILETKYDYWKYIVVATSYENPVDYLDDIEKEIGEYYGRVLFDLTLCNGLSGNRYCDILYKGKLFNISDALDINGDSIDKHYKNIINNYFKNNIKILNNGVLSDEQIQLLMKELLNKSE